MVGYSIVQYSIMQDGTALHSMVWYGMGQYGIVKAFYHAGHWFELEMFQEGIDVYIWIGMVHFVSLEGERLIKLRLDSVCRHSLYLQTCQQTRA